MTSKSMVNIPARLRARYKIQAGSKVVFIEKEGEITMVPVPSIESLFGIDRDHGDALRAAARELNEERRRETKSE